MLKENRDFTFWTDVQETYFVDSDDVLQEVVLKLSVDHIQSGLIKEIGTTNFAVLVAIASFMDGEGKCFPSYEKIMEITGVSRQTVATAIRKLSEVKINEKPLLVKQQESTGGRWRRNVYNFNNYQGAELK